MEIKKNDATINRPEGERIIDAPYVVVDMPAFTEQLLGEDSYSKNGKNGITVFKSEGLTQVITAMVEGEEIIENEVEGFVTIQVIKGKATLKTPGADTIISEKQFVTLHPHVVHSFKANSDLILLLTTITRISNDI